jgi:hypothetical protein
VPTKNAKDDEASEKTEPYTAEIAFKMFLAASHQDPRESFAKGSCANGADDFFALRSEMRQNMLRNILPRLHISDSRRTGRQSKA